MNLKNLTAAIAEADRFLKIAEKLRDTHFNVYAGHALPQDIYHVPREQGAVKRASMDLTRALADLRKPN